MKKHYPLSPVYRPQQLQNYILSFVISCMSFNLQANELNVVLADREQQLLHIAEQKRQLEVLNSLLPSLQELASYPQAATELLIDHNELGRLSKKDKQLLKQVVQALRPAFTQATSNPIKIEAYQPIQSNLGINTLLATTSNDQSVGKVVLQLNKSAQAVLINIGQSFKHRGKIYRLIDVQTEGTGSTKRFHISLKNPQGITTYYWPELF